jgi:hypothetical protein
MTLEEVERTLGGPSTPGPGPSVVHSIFDDRIFYGRDHRQEVCVLLSHAERRVTDKFIQDLDPRPWWQPVYDWLRKTLMSFDYRNR